MPSLQRFHPAAATPCQNVFAPLQVTIPYPTPTPCRPSRPRYLTVKLRTTLTNSPAPQSPAGARGAGRRPRSGASFRLPNDEGPHFRPDLDRPNGTRSRRNCPASLPRQESLPTFPLLMQAGPRCRPPPRLPSACLTPFPELTPVHTIDYTTPKLTGKI